ncbi:Hypothetical protein A7982_02125 [Minicystis rosea]|nr:Hypothetical protein A7982_02125 [Minicystis rosea]
MNDFASFEPTAPVLARLFEGAKLFGAFAAAIALSACVGQYDDASEDTQEVQQAVTSRPPCTAANEGAKITESVRGGYNVYQCDSGTWQLIRTCKTGGVCVDL